MNRPKKISIPDSVVRFTGDCHRQNQLNRTADQLAHLPNKPIHKPRRCSPIRDTACSILFFICLLGCAYGVMAL
jgi:hypothetical protein